MSYVSPPESRSRVENIKKKFEVTNNDLSTSVGSDSCFTKTPVNRNVLGAKAQPNNGAKSSFSPRKKVLHTTISNPVDVPKKSNPLPSIKTPPVGPIKAERQLSNPCGRGNIRRSPAFRCDKIVKGRNVTGQTSGVRDRTRSVVDNRVKLFEDGQSVKSVVKKLNTSPLASSNTEDVVNKVSRSQLQKQLGLEDDPAEKVGTATDSGNIPPTTHIAEITLVNKQSSSTNLGEKGTDLEKLSEAGIEYASVSKVQKQVSVSFLHKYESHKVKLPPENKRVNSKSTAENFTVVKNIEHAEVESHTKVTSVPDKNKASDWKGTNGIKSEKGQVSQETLQEESSSKSGNTLTDTLKAALKAPLPPGPPPKKPPRTFAHNTPSHNAGQHNGSVPSATTTSAINAVSNKHLSQHLKFTKSASEKTSDEKTVKPVRSKTESQIMLKKLESVLLNHQHSTGGVVLKPKSPMVKRHMEEKGTATYNKLGSNAGNPIGRVGPLPNLPLESELPSSQKTSADGDNNTRFGGCLKFNCVSANPNNPMYSQIHFYEKVPEKQSEFFVDAPKNHSPLKTASKPYGTLLHCRSRSEEHIYAEPFEYLNKTQNHRHNLQNQKSPGTAMKSGESVGDLSKLGVSFEELHNQMSPSLHPKNITSKTTLHYLCTPLHTGGTAGVAENGLKARNNEFKKIEPIVPTIAERRVGSEPESGSDERKKPPLLRLAALVRGGQTSGGVDVASNKVDRTKIQLLMNQAFGSPLQGLPTSPIELTGSDPDYMASTPDEGGFASMLQNLETEAAGAQSPDTSKAGLTTTRSVEPLVDGEDSTSTNSAEQQEQLTRQAEERKVYVRRVSSRVYQRVRSTATTPSAFPHLFQCILLVGLNLDSSDKKTKVPYIKTNYPVDVDVPPHIEHLCFPDARDWPPPLPTTPSQPNSGGNDEQSYSLVITSETGVRRFGYCRRVQPEGSSLCLPLAYCIISPFRASGFYYKILAELESRHGQPEWLQTAFIKELYSCQFPAPGQGIKLSTANTTYNIAGPVCSMVTTAVRRPLDSRLEERDLTQLFSALPVPALLQLFGSLLLERRVILISNSLSRLSSCVEALQSILYPFSWQHTLIPVLPTSLLDICLSPTPYIVGILRGRDASTVPGPIDESMMVDLDESRVLQGVGDEASILPNRLRRCLKVALQLVTNTTQPGDASRNVLVSEAFVRMFVEVCGHYRNHIVTQQDGRKVFERESFIKAVTSQSVRLFLEWFTETAMFSAFIESHLESESDNKGMFDQRCLEHSEEMENNTRLFLRNYRVLNKKVKTFGDRLKDWTSF